MGWCNGFSCRCPSPFDERDTGGLHHHHLTIMSIIPGVIKYYVPQRPPVAPSTNNNGPSEQRCCIYKKVSPTPSSSPASLDVSLNRPSNQPFYYFIRQGDFDLVWPNILVFAVAHVIYIYAFLNLDRISWKTWVWENQIGKYCCPSKRKLSLPLFAGVQ